MDGEATSLRLPNPLSITTIHAEELKYDKPRNASPNVEEMTTKELSEYQHRRKEVIKIQKMDERISAKMLQLQKMMMDRNEEIKRINSRRKLFDDNVATSTQMKVDELEIKRRKRKEAERKEEILETFRLGKLSLEPKEKPN
ncbi:hypothetical protein CRE_21905 [Caenorhabditis remanei]|uniref:Uncharacterized protein n=1 Tax=Caenorhabditis remanei TaxID=31234 RepID=E3MU94_CAERE|nr:hypothetical protein CRE_21905 [Caenorhabditis remanei]